MRKIHILKLFNCSKIISCHSLQAVNDRVHVIAGLILFLYAAKKSNDWK